MTEIQEGMLAVAKDLMTKKFQIYSAHDDGSQFDLYFGSAGAAAQGH